MPSSQSVSHAVSILTRSRGPLAIGAGAALASVIGVAAASTGPAASVGASHGLGLTSAAAISPALRENGAATAPTGRHAQSAGSAAGGAASPQAASAPAAQLAAPGGSVRSASPQAASAPAAQLAAPGGSVRSASPEAASAPAAQLAPPGGSVRSASPQSASAAIEQQAPPSGSVLGASPQVAAAPAEQQTAAAATSPSPGSHARVKSDPAQPGAAAGKPAAAPAPSQPAAAASQPPAAPAPQPVPQPYQVYDSVSPSSIPSSSQAVAVYANGNFAASPSQVGQRGLVLWIDTNGSDPNANVLDVEPGDATPSQAASWVSQKLDASPNSVAIVYTMKSDWAAVQAAINALPWWMPSHTRYWIADPTGVPHVVPGSQATQWYWGQSYDISTALPNF